MPVTSTAPCSWDITQRSGIALLTAAVHPDRVLGVVAIASWAPELLPLPADRAVHDFDEILDTEEGWAKENRHYWLRDWRGYAEFFFGELLSEPHSTKQREDCVGWAMETSPETMLAHEEAPPTSSSREDTEQLLRRVRCPVLAIHGDKDRCLPLSWSERIAELTGADLLVVQGAGHCPTCPRAGDRQPRDPRLRRPVPPGTGPAAPVDQAAGPPPPRAVPVLSDRARPRAAGPGRRRRAAQAAPGPAGGLAGPASGDRAAGPARRAHPPGVGVPGQRIGASGGRMRRA